jgi:hypothetical protein
VHPLGQRAILRVHRLDAVEQGLQAVGLLCPLLALGAQLGGALLHGGPFLGAEAAGVILGGLGHGRQSF